MSWPFERLGYADRATREPSPTSGLGPDGRVSTDAGDTLVDRLRMNAEMMRDGWQGPNLTELWHSVVVKDAAKDAAKDADEAADLITELLEALEAAQLALLNAEANASNGAAIAKVEAAIAKALGK
jgi:hypothetical protein